MNERSSTEHSSVSINGVTSTSLELQFAVFGSGAALPADMARNSGTELLTMQQVSLQDEQDQRTLHNTLACRLVS